VVGAALRDAVSECDTVPVLSVAADSCVLSVAADSCDLLDFFD
jgi:hypothetical protein